MFSNSTCSNDNDDDDDKEKDSLFFSPAHVLFFMVQQLYAYSHFCQSTIIIISPREASGSRPLHMNYHIYLPLL